MKYSEAHARFYTYRCLTTGCSSSVSSNEKLDYDYCDKCNKRYEEEMTKVLNNNSNLQMNEKKRIRRAIQKNQLNLKK